MQEDIGRLHVIDGARSTSSSTRQSGHAVPRQWDRWRCGTTSQAPQAPHRGARLIEPQNRVVVEREELAPSARAERHVVNERGLQGDRPDDGKQRLGLRGGGRWPVHRRVDPTTRALPHHHHRRETADKKERDSQVQERVAHEIALWHQRIAGLEDANAHVARGSLSPASNKLRSWRTFTGARAVLGHDTVSTTRICDCSSRRAFPAARAPRARAGCAAPGRWPCRRSSCLRG